MRYGLTESNRGNHEDRKGFPAQSSVLDEEALLHRVVSEYPLVDPESCRFFSRGDSDVYRVPVAHDVYYLKIYRPPHTQALAEAEAEFVSDLHAHGAPVVPAVARRDGRYATLIMASEGPRPALLFEAAPAAGFAADDVAACRELGRAVAGLHDVADCLIRRHALRILDAAAAMREMLRYARVHLFPNEYDDLEQLSGRVLGCLDMLSTEPPNFGPCHSDLALSNIRQRPDGAVVFFDFGDACYTWRASELAGARARLPGDGSADTSEHRDAFLAGYASVRALPDGIPQQLVTLVLFRRLLGFCSILASCPLRMGTEGFGRQFVDHLLPSIRDLAAALPGI